MSTHPFPTSRVTQIVAHTLLQIGFNAFNQSTLSILVNIFELYLMSLAKHATSLCTHTGRSKPNSYDVSFAFNQMHIDLVSLHEFLSSGWTAQLNYLEFDLRLQSIKQIPLPSIRYKKYIKHARMHDETWVLPPAYPILVPAEIIMDHIQTYPDLDTPLYITAVPTHQTNQPNHNAIEIDTHLSIDTESQPVSNTNNTCSYPPHIPTHLPPLVKSSLPHSHPLAIDEEDVWSKNSITDPPSKVGKPVKKVLTIEGSPTKIASWISAGQQHDGGMTDPLVVTSSGTSTQVDMELVRACHSRLPSSSIDNGPISTTINNGRSVLQQPIPPPPRLKYSRFGYLRRPQPPLNEDDLNENASTHLNDMLGRAMHAVNIPPTNPSKKPIPVLVSPPPVRKETKRGGNRKSQVKKPTPVIQPHEPLPPAIIVPMHESPAVVSLVTTLDSLYTRSNHNGLDPMYPRVDVCPFESSISIRARPHMDDLKCICEKPNLDDGSLLVQCGTCRVWFHGRCVRISSEEIVTGTVVDYFCAQCRKKSKK